MAGTEITIKAHDGGTFMGYLSSPKSGTGAGIVVIQEIFGVNQVMREICNDLAAQGYVTLCPDLFWRQQPGIQITDKTQAEWDQAFKLFGGFDLDKGMADLTSTLSRLRGLTGGKVGAVGYCLGGRLAYLMAARTDVDAAVGYYGVMLQDHLDEVKKIDKPLLLHIANEDKFVPKEAQQKVLAGVKGSKTVTTHEYAGQDHAFARVGGDSWNEQAAELANRRTAEFFQKHLRG
jgi:carboxymethylenebutenolidase